jgi:hypothetical protein
MKPTESVGLHHRLALAIVGAFLLLVVVVLPLAVENIVWGFRGPPSSRVYPLLAASGPSSPQHTRLNLNVVAFDDVQRQVTLRISGHHLCGGCAWSDRVVFVSIPPDALGRAAEGTRLDSLPPSASITLAPVAVDTTQTLQLPISGQPIRYPFDTYQLWLGIASQQVDADGTVRPMTPAEARGHLFLTIQAQLPHFEMGPPVESDAAAAQIDDLTYQYVTTQAITLVRPFWMKALTLLLVLMIAMAAAYAVFLRPLSDLVVNAGALVLGVWGIRAILQPGSPSFATAVDLSLSMVILFLLGAISVRALAYLWERNGLRRPGRRLKE